MKSMTAYVTEEVYRAIRKLAMTTEMNTGKKTTMNDILNLAIVSYLKNDTDKKEDPPTSKSSEPPSEQQSERPNKYSFNLDDL